MENTEQLQQYIDRIEKLSEEVNNIKADIRQVFAEAKGNGFDTKAIREVIKLKKMNPADRQEFNFLREEYSKLLNM